MARGTRLLRLAQLAAQANSKGISTQGKGALVAAQQQAAGGASTNGVGGGAAAAQGASYQQTRGAVSRGALHGPWVPAYALRGLWASPARGAPRHG
jgi:hypothetical protein